MASTSGAAGGADKAQLEIEMRDALGDAPELSTISSMEPISLSTLREDTQDFRTRHPIKMALVLVSVGLLVGQWHTSPALCMVLQS